MDTSVYWTLFLSAAVLLNIAPGPDMLFLISRTLTSGRTAGFASMLGLGTGALVHTLFVSLGISMILSTSLIVFQVIKWTGAAYLFYLGIQAILYGGIRTDDGKRDQGRQKISLESPSSRR